VNPTAFLAYSRSSTPGRRRRRAYLIRFCNEWAVVETWGPRADSRQTARGPIRTLLPLWLGKAQPFYLCTDAIQFLTLIVRRDFRKIAGQIIQLECS